MAKTTKKKAAKSASKHKGAKHTHKKSEAKSKAHHAGSSHEKPKCCGSSNMWVFLAVAVLIVIGIVYFVQNNAMSTSDEKAVEGNVLATVNGVPITDAYLDKVAEILVFLRGLPQDSAKDIPRNVLLNQTISREVFYQTATKEGYSMTKEDVEKTLEGLLKNIGATLDQYRKAMENATFTYDEFIEFNRRQIIIGNYLNETVYSKIKISDDEARQFYDANQQLFNAPAQIRASHILVKTEEEAKQIISQLNNGADFATLAKEKSVGPTGVNGGDLGFFAKGRMVKEFEDAAFALQNVGDYTKEPVKTQFGYHVIKLTDKRDAGIVPFEDVKEQIKQQLAIQRNAEEVDKLAEKLKSGMDIVMS